MAWLGRTRRVHFVGIGGIGMSGIAELLANLGYEVSGSDARRSEVTDRLAQDKMRKLGTVPRTLRNADVVVVSSAIDAANPEVDEARSRHVPVISVRRNARRADASAVRHCRRRRSRKDDDHIHGRADARAGRTRSRP